MRSDLREGGGPSTFGRPGGGRVLPFRSRRSNDRQAAGVANLVARRRRIPLHLLLHRQRKEADIAGARMLAMYLVHVMLGRTYSEVGLAFGRDRTTVAHACAKVEDLRDDPAFDAEVCALEAEIENCDIAAEASHATG